MRIEKIVCDGCGREYTKRFYIFKECKYNGVDNEDWYYVFDLCFACCEVAFQKVLSNASENGLLSNVDTITTLGIKVRVE